MHLTGIWPNGLNQRGSMRRGRARSSYKVVVLFATAVGAIQRWMDEGPEKDLLDDTVWEQLQESLDYAGEVIASIENEMQPLMVSELSRSTKLKVQATWNKQALKAHRNECDARSLDRR
jgi:hypothetical protein